MYGRLLLKSAQGFLGPVKIGMLGSRVQIFVVRDTTQVWLITPSDFPVPVSSDPQGLP